MVTDTIERQLKEKVSALIRVSSEGVDRFRIFTPFRFEDGDHLAIVLKRKGGDWVLSDEGHTYMRLTYRLDEQDLRKGTRQKIITGVLCAFSVEDRDGELMLPIRDEAYGDALYSFIQAILKISDVTYLSREIVRSTFMEDFKRYMEQQIPEQRRSFDWHDPVLDRERKYTVDCRVNGMSKPIFIFALPNDDRVKDATITIHQFERWNVPHDSVGIFEDQEQINRKVLARFTNVVGKAYSSLSGNTDRISRFLEEHLRS